MNVYAIATQAPTDANGVPLPASNNNNRGVFESSSNTNDAVAIGVPAIAGGLILIAIALVVIYKVKTARRRPARRRPCPRRRMMFPPSTL